MPIINMVYKKKKGWKPGANTVAYYPFRSDILDHSGNKNNFTGSGYSFSNNMITTTSELIGPIVTPENTIGDRTINIWCNRNNVAGYSFRGSNNGTDGYLNAKDGENGNRPGASFKTSSWYRNRPSASDLPAMGNVILMTWTKTGDTMKLYIDGVLTSTTTLNTSTRSSSYGITKSSLSLGTFGEIIIEDKIRTPDEILKYYNDTKEKYLGGGYTPGAYTVAYFPLNTDLLDHGPNQYSMTNLGGVTIDTAQVVGKGVAYFNGSSRLYKTDISSGLPLTTSPKTMSLWVKHISGITHCGFGKMYSDNPNRSFILCGLSGKLGFSTWGGRYDFASSITPSSSLWYHTAVSYDGTTWKHYVNGTQVNSGTLSIQTNGTTLCLGADSETRSGYENYFTGYLSEVIIENRTWSTTDVSNYYNSTKSNYGL